MADQAKEYYEKKPGYVVKSGCLNAAQQPIDYSVTTDAGQGFQYTLDGNKYDVCNKTSMEVCGILGQENVPAKVIRADIGDIILEALSGEIVLRARSIRIVAQDGSGEVTINAGKNITIKGPIANIDATNLNLSGKNNVSVGAGAYESFGKVSQSEVKGTELIQEPINSFLSGAIKWLKFFIPA